jgi:putative ABC transport system permease protein
VRAPAEGLLLNRQIAAKLGLAPGDLVRVEFLEGRRAKVETRLAATVDEFLGAGAYMDRDALNRLLDEQGRVNVVAIKTDASEAGELYARLKNAPNVAAVATRARTLQSFRETMAGMIVTMSFILFLFAVVIAGGVVYNTAAVSLSERTWELASLRVLGFTRAEVFQILLGELAFQLVLALPLGCLMGFALAKLMVQSTPTEGFQIPVALSSGTYAWAILTTLFAAAASAAIIRRRINHLDLIGVLKVRE